MLIGASGEMVYPAMRRGRRAGLKLYCRDGEIGRHAGFRSQWEQSHGSSSLPPGTKNKFKKLENMERKNMEYNKDAEPKNLEYIKDISWDEVFENWRRREGTRQE